DADLCCFFLNIGELRKFPDIDKEFGRCEPQFHHWDQAMAAGKDLCSATVFLQQVHGFAQRCRDDVLEVLCNHDALLPFRIRQTFAERAGMSMGVTQRGESASKFASTIAGVAPIAPASPTPFTPNGFTGDGVIVRSSSNSGKSCARGMA